MFFRTSQAVCPEMKTILFPLATTIWEKPCGKLEKRLFGLTYSLGINQGGALQLTPARSCAEERERRDEDEELPKGYHAPRVAF